MPRPIQVVLFVYVVPLTSCRNTFGGSRYPMFIVDLLLVLIIVFLVYATVVGSFGLWNSSKGKDRHSPTSRFAVLVPAHDEEAVIEPLLESLGDQEYPGDLYDIYVIADNCSDSTADRARSAGAEVMERTSRDARGKGHALRYGLEQLDLLGPEASGAYDAVVFFDADNLVDPSFLQVMNDRLLSGEDLIQAFLDSKNPADTWISSAYSLLFWLNCRYMMLARYNLGLSAAFMGTGMCISAAALADVGWNVETLTEDLEYSAQAVLKGYPTHYTHETRVYDEKPLTFAASAKQRLRWARGQFAVAFGYLIPLISSGIKNRCPVRLEAGARLCQLFVILAASPVFWLHSHLGGGENWGMAGAMLDGIPFFPQILVVVPYSIMVYAAVVDGHPAETYVYAPLYPVFTFSWLFIMLAGLFTVGNKRWMPTEHRRALDMARINRPRILTVSPRDVAQYETRIAMAGGFSGTNWN